MIELLEVILGKRIPQRIVDRVMVYDKHRSLIFRYELWGANIVKYPFWRDLNGKGPSSFYDLDGRLILNNSQQHH